MKKKFTLLAGFLPPITSDTVFDERHLQAITFRNGGTATVSLGNGFYTLDPKETISFSAVDNNDELVFTQWSIKFDTSTGSDKLLQMTVLRAQECT